MGSAATKVSLKITGMSCAACSARVERGLNKTPGIEQAQVNLALNTGTVLYHQDLLSVTDIIHKIEDIGYGVAVDKVELKITGMT